MRTAVLSFLVLSAVSMGAIGLYSTQAAADRAAIDGYGISLVSR